MTDDQTNQPKAPAPVEGGDKIARTGWILWIIAAVLAFTAWAIDFFKDGRVRYTSLALGLFCLTMAIVTRRRR